MAMKTTWGFEIPDKFPVDIQDIYYIKGSTGRSGMAALTGEIINETYNNMKSKLPPKGTITGRSSHLTRITSNMLLSMGLLPSSCTVISRTGRKG